MASESTDSLYCVRNIKSNKKYYLIELSRNDSLFLVLSEKKNNSLFCDSITQIKKGNYYYFDLFEKRSITLLGIFNYLDVEVNYKGKYNNKRNKSKPFKGFCDGKIRIKYEEKYHNKIYGTNNLWRLFYCKK